MQKVRLVVFSALVVYFSACTNFYSVPSAQTDVLASKAAEIDFSTIIKIPQVQSGFDLGYGLGLQSNGDIWATRGWNTRGGHVYRWSLKDREWHPVKLPSNTGILAEIYFENLGDCWLFSDRTMLRSRDGGQTWNTVPLEPKSEITRLQAINFIDSGTGFIGGTTGYMNRETFEPEQGVEILCTTDGGQQFHVCFKSKEHQTVHKILDLKQKNTVIAVIDGTYLLATKNSGKDWTKTTLPTSGNDAAIDHESRIWIVGNAGTFLYSRDLGDSWTKPEIDIAKASQVDWKSIAFGDNGVGVAVGNGGLFAISENGQDWRITKSEKINEDLYDVVIRGSYIAVRGKENFYSIRLKD